MGFSISATIYVALLTLPYSNNSGNTKILIDMYPYFTIQEEYSDEPNDYGFLNINNIYFDFENDIEFRIPSTNRSGSATSYIYNNELDFDYINDTIIEGIESGQISGFYLQYLEKEGWLNIFIKEIIIDLSPSYEIVPSDTENIGIYCIYDLSIRFNLQIGNWYDYVDYTINELDSFTIDTLINFETYGVFNVDLLTSTINFYNESNAIDYLYDTYEGIYENGYDEGYTDGERDGYENGEEYGYNLGYTDGERDGYNKKYDFLEIIRGAFDAVSNFFNMEIFPGVKFIYIIGIPLVIAVLRFVIGWFR